MTNPDGRSAASCEELRELLPAYAAGLVDTEERALFEAGLLDCPDLMPELQEYADFTDALLFSMPPMAAPSRILDNLMELTAPVSSSSARVSADEVIPAIVKQPVVPATGTPSGNPLVAFFRPTLRTRPALIAAVLALLVLTNLYWVIELQRRDTGTPSSLLLNFAPLDSTAQRVNFEHGRIAWSKSSAAETWLAVFSVDELSPLAEGTYQLWLVRQDEVPVSAGLFNVDDTGNGTLIFEVSEPIGTFDRVGVTVEPSGGSPEPTGQAVFSGEL